MNGFKPSEIDFVILCGGSGERLKSVIKDRPKPMAPMGGRPFLDILIGHLEGFGFRRFILCAGYKGEVVRDHYAAKTGPSEFLTIMEKTPLGTGGAVRNAQPALASNPFIVANGDSFCPLDYLKFIEFYLSKKALYSMAVVELPENRDGGLVRLNRDCRITGFDEKAASGGTGYINAGIYMLDKTILDIIEPGRKISLEYDIFPKLCGKEFYGYRVSDKLTDIGTPDRFYKAQGLFGGEN